MLKIPIYLAFALLLCPGNVRCKCKTTFMASCEKVSDVPRYGTETWTKLVIQDNPCTALSPSSELSETLMPDTFAKTTNLEHLYVARKIKEIKPGAFRNTPNLYYLQFYKNELKVLQKNTFTGLRALSKLDAWDNAIENINHGLFEDAVVYEVDFSSNKIRTLQVGQLNIPSLKKLTLKNNFVSSLAVGCFHEQLQHLHLDGNELATIDLAVFAGLGNLKTLTLSNNKFQDITKIPRMESLERLDLSHNTIHSVDVHAFENLIELRWLSLGYNKLTTVHASMFPENSIAVLHLHMNYLTNILTEVTRSLSSVKELTLGGNPWICKCLLGIKTFLAGNGVKLADCDTKFFESGEAPVCVVEDRTNCSTQRISPSFLSEEYALEFKKLLHNYNCP